MDVPGLRARYFDQLLNLVNDTEFPSVPMLERVEQAIREPEQLMGYVEVLLEKTRSQYPSIELIKRIDGLIGYLERIDAVAT